MSKKCISCGKEIDDDAEVCELCGAEQYEPDEEDAPDAEENREDTGETSVRSKKFVFERFVRYGIPAVVAVIIAVAVISLAVSLGSYKRAVDKYFTYLCKDKPEKYITVVSDLQYSEPVSEYIETSEAINNLVYEFSNSLQKKVGNVKKVDIEIISSETIDDDTLEYLILLSGNAKFSKDSVEKGKSIDFSVIITGSEGAETLNCKNYYVLKENGSWKVCTSADTVTE